MASAVVVVSNQMGESGVGHLLTFVYLYLLLITHEITTHYNDFIYLTLNPSITLAS